MNEKKNCVKKNKEDIFSKATLNHYVNIMFDQISFYGIKEAKKTLYDLTDISRSNKDLIWECLMGDNNG